MAEKKHTGTWEELRKQFNEERREGEHEKCPICNRPVYVPKGTNDAEIPEGWVDVKGAAEIMGIGLMRTRNLAREGAFGPDNVRKLGNRWIINVAAIMARTEQKQAAAKSRAEAARQRREAKDQAKTAGPSKPEALDEDTLSALDELLDLEESGAEDENEG